MTRTSTLVLGIGGIAAALIAGMAIRAAARPNVTTATQARLDEVVHKCTAENVVRLKAESAKRVRIEMLIGRRAPTAAGFYRFDCVLAEMRRMPDLQYGFVGNAL